MAVRKGAKRNLKNLEIISEQDDAVDMDQSDWDQYKETCDTKYLVFKPNTEPTIFLCDFELKGKEAENVKNAMLKGVDEDGNPSLAIGSYSHRIVKYTLKDIKNPGDLSAEDRIEYKKESGQYAHADTIAELETLGIVTEIFNFYTRLVLAGARANAKN